jgi:hypothetical protein
MGLELQKYTRSLRRIMDKINPRKFVEIINEANMVFITTNRCWSRSPNIYEN